MPIISKRLLAAADLLNKSMSVADIGTDHALLPIHLVREGIANKVIACDIATGPLEVAKANVAKFGLENEIELRLANGLEGLKKGECDQITILGMGGETIADIIDATDWVRDENVTLILQPMSCDDRLRQYLITNGFEIKCEVAVTSQGRVYTVMKVTFTGKKLCYGNEFKYIGLLAQNKTDDAVTFIKNRLKSMKTCMAEIENVPRKKELFDELKIATEIIEKLI